MSPMAGDRWNRKRLWRFAATKWKVIVLLCCVATMLFVLIGTVSPFSGVSSEQCEGAAVMDAPWTPLHTESQSPKLSDLVVHRRNKAGEVVKVLFVVASSKIESSVCRNVASAYMSGCPVVLVGFDTKLDSRNRMKYALSAAKEAGLSGEDVIVLLDSVTMFTGMDPFKFIDHFIDKSPATADALKAADVRNGTAMAPFYVAAQEWCSSSMSSLNNGDPCKSMWRSLKKMFSTYYANVLLEQKNYAYNVNIFNESKYATQYIDSGVTVSRLWTMEAVNEEFHRVIRQHEEDARVSGVVAVINSQVVLQLLYFNHLLNELPFQPTEQHVVGVNRMAMGTVDLDYFQHICSLRWGHQNLVELHTRLWGEPNNNSHVDTHDRLSLGKDWFYNCTSHAQLAQFIRQSVDSKKLPSKELHFSVGNKQYSSRVVPPVFSRQYQADVGYVYPFLRHYPFDDASRQMDNDGIFMAWGIPILVDAEARRNAHTMLRSVRIVTHSPEKSPSVRSHEYAENCDFPFKSWGLHPIDA